MINTCISVFSDILYISIHASSHVKSNSNRITKSISPTHFKVTKIEEYDMNENKNESKFMSKVSPKLTASIGNNRSNQGFVKVVAGGRIIRLRKDAPFYERLVTGEQIYIYR